MKDVLINAALPIKVNLPDGRQVKILACKQKIKK